MENTEILIKLEQIVRLSFLILFIPLIIGIYRYRSLIKEQKLVLIIITVLILNDGLTYYLRELGVNNLWVYHLFVPVQFCLITVLYRGMLRGILSRNTMFFGIILFLIISALNTFFLQDLEQFNSNAIYISYLVFIGYTLMFFYGLLRSPVTDRLENLPQFWINLAVLIYYSSSTLFIVMVNDFQATDAKSLSIIWSLNIGLYVLLNVLYSIGLMKSQSE